MKRRQLGDCRRCGEAVSAATVGGILFISPASPFAAIFHVWRRIRRRLALRAADKQSSSWADPQVSGNSRSTVGPPPPSQTSRSFFLAGVFAPPGGSKVTKAIGRPHLHT